MSPFTSLALKLVGTIFIISSIIDYITLAIPFEPLKQEWQINYTNAVVDRGIVPLLGLVLLIIAYWIDSLNTGSGGKGFDLRVPAFILASFLGLLFLLLVPLHLSNLSKLSSNAVAQIQQKADEAETSLKAQFDQLNSLTKDPQKLQQLNATIAQLDQAIGSGTLQGQTLNAGQVQELTARKQQLQNFQQLAKNPKQLKTKLEELQTKLREEKLNREGRATTEALKQGIRTGLSSLLLSIGYITIGWLGLRGAGSRAAMR